MHDGEIALKRKRGEDLNFMTKLVKRRRETKFSNLLISHAFSQQA